MDISNTNQRVNWSRLWFVPASFITSLSTWITHPHLAQVPVVVIRLVLVGQLSAQDDAVLPTLRTKTHIHSGVVVLTVPRSKIHLSNNEAARHEGRIACAPQCSCYTALRPLGGTNESTKSRRVKYINFMQVHAARSHLAN